jgi:hypothetical protein
VAQQTADSPELVSKIANIAAGDPAAEFVLLVPVTPVKVLLSTAEEKVAFDTAHQTAEAARSLFEKAGAKVIGVRVGDDSLIRAIRDELWEHPDNYDAIILSTLPSLISHRLHLDLPSRVQRTFHLPVIHVTVHSNKHLAHISPEAGERSRRVVAS